MTKLVLAVIGVAAACGAGAAETYYVDQKHPQAADTNAGTADAPFRHIQAAVDRVRPGDTITVQAGTYREMIVWKTPGEAGKPITLQAATGATVVIKGSVLVKGWERISAAEAGLKGDFPSTNLWIKRDWRRETIYPEDEPNHNSPHRHFLSVEPRWAFWKDAVLYEGAGWITFAYTRDELQEGRLFPDKQAQTLTIWLPPGVDPNANGVEVCVRGLLLYTPAKGGSDHLVIRGLQWRHANTRNTVNWGAVSIGSHGVFEDNIVSWCDYVGFGAGYEDTVIRRNTFACTGAGGLGGGGRRLLIEDNRCLYNNLDRHETYANSGGGKFCRIKESVFRRHETAYNFGPGLWLDIECDDNVFESCTFHHNHGPGVFVEISNRNLFRNCIFAFNTEMPGGMNVKFEFPLKSPTADRTRYYTERGDLGWGAYNSSSQGTRYLNCLFYANQNAGLVCEGGWREDGSIPTEGKAPKDGDEKGWTTTRNLVIKNNIFSGNGGAQLILRHTGIDPACTGHDSDYNLFDLAAWTGAALGSESYGGPAHRGLDEWREATGLDRHSLAAGAELVLPAGGDYRPTALSPAADRGTPLLEVPADFAGRKRPVGRGFDIGPFENYSVLAARPETGVPAGLTFQTLDLSRLMNRTLTDEQAEDGKGGWSDQGPACDLRDFATALPKDPQGRPSAGTVRLADVNFRVEYPLSLLVLTRDGFRGQLPDRAEMPVDARADFLFFLHTTAWGGDWDYVVHYADGQQAKVEIRCPNNMRDWATGNAAAAFRFETGTHTRAAWIGKSGSFPEIAIFRTAWPNPRPEAKIARIEVVQQRGVVGLLAVTLGRK